ncbi:MAG: OadG family protein [Leptospiraceae bacterium]|nr:OadG family protein [Leptospiraceae bacterium]
MDSLLIEGFQLMLFGMGIVFVYLILMVYAIKLIAILFKTYSEKEEQNSIILYSGKKISSNTDELSELIPVISAAIHTHRKGKL